MIGFARKKWSGFYSEIPDGFKRLALVLAAVAGLNLLVLFNAKNEFSELFRDESFLVMAVITSIGTALSWLFFMSVIWLWSNRESSRVIRLGALLVVLWPVGYVVIRHSFRILTEQRQPWFSFFVGSGLVGSGFVALVLLLLVTLIGWVRVGGFSQDDQPRFDARTDGARGGEHSEHDRDLNYHYAVLCVSPTDSIEAIKRAYREKMKQYHPDKVAGLGPKLRRVAEEESKAITSAYAIIMEELS